MADLVRDARPLERRTGGGGDWALPSLRPRLAVARVDPPGAVHLRPLAARRAARGPGGRRRPPRGAGGPRGLRRARARLWRGGGFPGALGPSPPLAPPE